MDRYVCGPLGVSGTDASVGFWKLLQPGGYRLTGESIKGAILTIDNISSAAQEMMLRIDVAEADVLWMAFKDGSRQFPFQSTPSSYHVAIGSDLVEIGIILTKRAPRHIRMRVDLVGSLVKSFHTRCDSIIAYMFLAMLGGGPLITSFGLLLFRAVLVSLPHYNPSRLLVDSLFSLWTAVGAYLLCHALNDVSHEPRIKKGLMIGLAIVLLMTPCITSVKVTILVAVLLGMDLCLYQSLTTKGGIVLVATLPMIVECMLEVRNLLIIRADVGLSAALKELGPRWTVSVEILPIVLYVVAAPSTRRVKSRPSLGEMMTPHIHLIALSLEVQKSYMMVGFLAATLLA